MQMLIGENVIIPFWVAALQLLAGILMLLGLFWRPSWRSWLWVGVTGVAVFAEIIYFLQFIKPGFNFIRISMMEELAFTVMVMFGFFRAILDTLIRREIKRYCAQSPNKDQ